MTHKAMCYDDEGRLECCCELRTRAEAALTRVDEFNEPDAVIDVGDWSGRPDFLEGLDESTPGEITAYVDENYEVAFIDADGYTHDDPPPDARSPRDE